MPPSCCSGVENGKNYTRYLTDEGVEKAKELLEQIGPPVFDT